MNGMLAVPRWRCLPRKDKLLTRYRLETQNALLQHTRRLASGQDAPVACLCSRVPVTGVDQDVTVHGVHGATSQQNKYIFGYDTITYE